MRILSTNGEGSASLWPLYDTAVRVCLCVGVLSKFPFIITRCISLIFLATPSTTTANTGTAMRNRYNLDMSAMSVRYNLDMSVMVLSRVLLRHWV